MVRPFRKLVGEALRPKPDPGIFGLGIVHPAEFPVVHALVVVVRCLEREPRPQADLIQAGFSHGEVRFEFFDVFDEVLRRGFGIRHDPPVEALEFEDRRFLGLEDDRPAIGLAILAPQADEAAIGDRILQGLEAEGHAHGFRLIAGGGHAAGEPGRKGGEKEGLHSLSPFAGSGKRQTVL